jgi:hypothetical protein
MQTLGSFFHQWRNADAAAREEERRLFYAAVHSVDAGVAPTDEEWIFCGELRSAADALFYLATQLRLDPPLAAAG